MPDSESSPLASAYQAFQEAMAHEERLRVLVHGKGPGTPDHDPAAWADYLKALQATTAASKALRAASSSGS